MKPTPMKCGLLTIVVIGGIAYWLGGKNAPKESPEPPRAEQKR